jgi:uncharacterized Zn finger protein
MFRTAKCGHCGNSGTKAEVIEPSEARFKQLAICCQSCGSILGVTGYFDAGKVAKDIEAKQAILERKIDALDHNIRAIAVMLQRG